MKQHVKDCVGGGLMFLIGVAAVVQSVHYDVGTLTQMGSGFFPTVLGAVLALIGAAIALRAKGGVGVSRAVALAPEWRGWICILLSIVAFAALGTYGGLVPATFGSVFIAALGDRKNSILSALLLALVMVAIAVIIFWWALQVQFPLFQWGGR